VQGVASLLDGQQAAALGQPRRVAHTRQQARRMSATSQGACSPLRHFPEYVAGAKVGMVGIGFGLFLG
jgi:hypothetical protein